MYLCSVVTSQGIVFSVVVLLKFERVLIFLCNG